MDSNVVNIEYDGVEVVKSEWDGTTGSVNILLVPRIKSMTIRQTIKKNK